MATWLSRPAVLWVWDEAPDVPPSLMSTLLTVARFADNTGCGAFPSVDTIARLTRKSESQVRRDLARLQDKKLLQRGDQQLVAYIRGDKRPVVYDLPMPRGSTDATPQEGHGVAPMRERGSTSARSGVASVLPEEFLKNSGSGAANGYADAEPCQHGEPRGAWACFLCRTAVVTS